MIILIDSGNTRIKVGVVYSEASIEEDARSTPDSQASQMRTAAFGNDDTSGIRIWLEEHIQAEAQVTDRPLASNAALRELIAWGVNVAGDEQANKLESLFMDLGCLIHWRRAEAMTGRLTNGYALTSQLGADRWASLVGASVRQARHHAPFILATFGTATTIDTVSAEDVFEGGMILPGPAMMALSLAHGTANLPLVNAAGALFPTDTETAIATGIASAQAGALVRQFILVYTRFEIVPEIFVTGGGWQAIETETRRLINETSNLLVGVQASITELKHPVLDGLLHMAAERRTEGK